MKKYICKAGKHNFIPQWIPRFWAFWGVLEKVADKSAMWAFEFNESAWFDWRLPDGSIDQDVKDWNFKLCGLAPAAEDASKNGVMLAGKPNPETKNEMLLTFYQNIDGKIIANDDSSFGFIIDPLNPIRIYCRMVPVGPKRIKATVWAQSLSDSSELWKKDHVFTLKKNYSFFREIFLWFGGENNADGEFGGTPSADIWIMADCI